MIYHRVCNQINKSLVKQELLTLPENLSSPVISGVCVSRSLVLCVLFCKSVFVFFLLSIVYSVLRLTILITLWHLKTLLISGRPHNRWCHHEGKHIVFETYYYNTTYNTTYSVVSFCRLSNEFPLTSDIGFLFMVLKYSFTLYSSNI